jgi:hypothetical protein
MIYEDDKLILKKRVFISSQQINKVYLPWKKRYCVY